MTSTAPSIDDATSAVDRYLAALNEPDQAARDRLIGEAWSEQGGMTDPPLAGQGHEGIAGLCVALHQQFPGHAFRRTSVVDAHHDRLRFAWSLIGPQGAVAVTGTDFAVLADDGRVGQVTGFFGELAPRGQDD